MRWPTLEYDQFQTTMRMAGINAILFGAMLVALGMMPDLIITLLKELENVRRHFSPGPIRNFEDDMQVSGGWLVGCGAVVMLLGLLALLFG